MPLYNFESFIFVSALLCLPYANCKKSFTMPVFKLRKQDNNFGIINQSRSMALIGVEIYNFLSFRMLIKD